MPEVLSEKDERQLSLLSLFHNVVAVLWAVATVYPLTYLGTGMNLVGGDLAQAPESGESIGRSVIAWSVATAILTLVRAALTFAAGWRLSQRKARSFCMVVASINCCFFPFGTALGILTLVVLKRPSVREAFVSAPRHPNLAASEDTKLP